MLPAAWRYLSYLFPYTWGVHGFLHINTMGATLATTAREYHALWLLAGGYFLTTCLALAVMGKVHDRKLTIINN